MDDNLFLSAKNLLSLRGLLNSIHLHPAFREQYKDRLEASDLAFLSYQASLRANVMAREKFHESFFKFREGTADRSHRYLLQLRMRRAVFDHAAALDLASGGTTLVVHMPGAQEPGTPASPEFLKAYVYVPSTVIQEIESQGKANPIPEIIQTIIKELHVPTVERFQEARTSTWGVSRVLGPWRPRPLPEIYGMPTPIPEGSSRYIFYGRRDIGGSEADTYPEEFEGFPEDAGEEWVSGTPTASSGDVD